MSTETTCDACGSVIVYAGRGRPRRFCSDRCVRAYRAKLVAEFGRQIPCAGCGGAVATFTSKPSEATCLECKPRIKRDERTCFICGAFYVPNRASQSFCSSACYGLSQRRPEDLDKSSRQLQRERRRRWDRKRRAMLRDAKSEPYTRDQVAERSSWSCGICGKCVGRSYDYPHPRSGVIDHIVPLSRGGDDTLRNVQLAHHECNAKKGAGVALNGEQLRLV